MFNNDLSYARSRMVGSYMLCKVKDWGLAKVIDVRGEGNDFEKSSVYAVVKDKQEVKLKATDFEFSVGKLGYVNQTFSGEAMFVSRIPIRRDFKQGLRSSQLCYVRANAMSNLSDNWLDQNVKAVSDCVRSVFPSLDTAIENVEEYNADVAFSRNFALSKKNKLLYKGFLVGSLNKKDRLELNNNFNFLEAELTKEVGNDRFSR